MCLTKVQILYRGTVIVVKWVLVNHVIYCISVIYSVQTKRLPWLVDMLTSCNELRSICLWGNCSMLAEQTLRPVCYFSEVFILAFNPCNGYLPNYMLTDEISVTKCCHTQLIQWDLSALILWKFIKNLLMVF